MKIAVIENDKIVVKDTERLSLAGREGAIVKVLGSGLCGSDIVKFREHLSGNGTVLGHEIVAQIMEINSETSFKEGDFLKAMYNGQLIAFGYAEGGLFRPSKVFKGENDVDYK